MAAGDNLNQSQFGPFGSMGKQYEPNTSSAGIDSSAHNYSRIEAQPKWMPNAGHDLLNNNLSEAQDSQQASAAPAASSMHERPVEGYNPSGSAGFVPNGSVGYTNLN